MLECPRIGVNKMYYTRIQKQCKHSPDSSIPSRTKYGNTTFPGFGNGVCISLLNMSSISRTLGDLSYVKSIQIFKEKNK